VNKDANGRTQVLAIVFEGMKILVGLTILLEKQAVKDVIDFEEGKMLEVFDYAFGRQDFFAEGFIPGLMASVGNSFFTSPF